MPTLRCPSVILKAAIAATLSWALVAGVPSATAEEPVKPDEQQKPDDKKDAPVPDVLKPAAPIVVEVSEDAKPIIAKLREAYAKLGGLQMSGTWRAEWDVDGEQDRESAEFTSSYAAPNRFRHETKDDLLFGSTGEQAYSLTKNLYLTGDAPKDRGAVADLPTMIGRHLKMKNPALLLAVTTDETPFLADDATAIAKGADVTIDGVAYPALKVDTKNGEDVTVLIDPATGLMRQWSIDLIDSFRARGRDDVVKAVMTIDYASVKAEAPAADAFAWAPPAGAKDASKPTGDVNALVGKPAPAFELETADDTKVKLDDLKGSVVLLDFWASWCGPCVVSMPGVERVAKAREKDGLKAFAVNQGEDKVKIEEFVKAKNVGLTVLLDEDETANKAYGADQVIPLTVIVGKDGYVSYAAAGIHPEDELSAALDAALAK